MSLKHKSRRAIALFHYALCFVLHVFASIVVLVIGVLQCLRDDISEKYFHTLRSRVGSTFI